MKILWLGLEHSIGENTHQVCIMNKNNFSMEVVKMFDPDIIIEREFNDGRHVWYNEVMELKKWKPEIKTAVWLIDTHVAYQRHKNYIRHFDFVFMAISRYAEEFKAFHPHVYWLPLCYPSPTLPANEKNIYPLGFVGRITPDMTKRVELLKALEEHYGNLCHFVTDYATVYKTMSQCTIMVNQSYADDLNFRVFEALACGNILVTNSVPDLFKVDTLKARVFPFETPQGAIHFIDTILQQEKKTDVFTQVKENRQFIKERHMIQHRVEKIIEVLIEGGSNEALSY